MSNHLEEPGRNSPQAQGLQPVGLGLDDPRTLAAVEEYLAELESGRHPDRRAFLARYPDIADVLASCLDGLDFVRQTAPSLAGVPSPVAMDAVAPEQPMRLLGDFQIGRELGRGGMGIVYEAVQVSLGRRVALKVLPFAAALDSRQLQRFKNEAQAAAHLHHTNIVPVFGVGCESGVHYYAMQFIEGKTLAQVIDEQAHGVPSVGLGQAATGSAPTVPIARLSTEASTRMPGFFRTAAMLGIQAAEAIEHAHDFGVIHRDIKPANLMIDERNHLWITDFGLARSQGEVGLTMTGDVLGTLRYMSPEQALAKRGLVDHRTDIYALGATLYELLTHEPVFPGHDRQELLRQIAFDEPRPLRSHDRAIPRELETILLKALAKHPEERYATAQEMADDLRRFTDDRPILARRPSLRERAVRWSRRHRPVLVSAVLGLVLAVIALAASTIMISQEQGRTQLALQNAIQAGDQERQARLREEEALRKETEARLRETEVRQRAEENFRQARQVVDYLSQIAADDLKDMPELHELRKKILKTALKYYEALIEQSHDDDLREELVASSVQVADILSKIGNKSQAFVMYEVARLTAENAVQKKPTAAGLQRLYWIWDRQGSARLGLLNSAEVQQDLALTPAQRIEIKQMTARRTKVLEEAVGQPDQARYDKLFSLANEEEKELDRVLTADQSRRLSEIVLQQRGMEAFRDPKVVAALQLDVEQESRITSILAESRRPWSSKTREPGTGTERTPTPREQLLAVLTPEQKAKWQELAGKPSPVGVMVADLELTVPPPTLGAAVEPPGALLTLQLGLGRGQGLLVTSVQADSPAAKAGLLVHDILCELDGKAVPADPTEFGKLLNNLKRNTPLEVVVIRKGQKITLAELRLPAVDSTRVRFLVPAEPDRQPTR
jgi:eukaryotic-like serine/threonine-protein kinase